MQAVEEEGVQLLLQLLLPGQLLQLLQQVLPKALSHALAFVCLHTVALLKFSCDCQNSARSVQPKAVQSSLSLRCYARNLSEEVGHRSDLINVSASLSTIADPVPVVSNEQEILIKRFAINSGMIECSCMCGIFHKSKAG